jgi:SAM-dependent methyltransferase
MDQKTANKIINLNKQSYNSVATQFSRSRKKFWPILKKLAKYISKDSKVLDIGCGNGRLLRYLNDKQILKYKGIDFSKELLCQAQKQVNTLDVKFETEFCLGDMTKSLPLDKSKKFDFIFAIATICHLPNHKMRNGIFKQILNSLNSNGYFIMTNWNMWQFSFKKKSIYKWWLQKAKFSEKEFEKLFGFSKKQLSKKDVITFWQNKYPVYYYAFTKREIGECLKKLGFLVIENYYEKNGYPSVWFKGNNIVTVVKKPNRV